ncbi:MAG: hypothetical protein COT24_04680 [Candidatus Kerfeldbacteria bacterium CG08_land_8_20_14_0_20_40_16]|uniref:Transport permease protein n=1 Tax=Candidatus Kerfeldbacteria bacterium CG08_land_8_20_14_0_20_40_16 TaxID=2014244 RepID=A0A2H0YV73_9BACT|nr:MAG: hypothetical protein COT24_04680 [Candidatus Kerfeldbacteria bacterium CG08_land_8_20_14_0_20_40_16]
MILWKLFIANLKMYFRNKQALFWALFFPLLIMIVFGLMNFEGEGTLRVGVVNKSSSPMAEEFINQISKVDVLKITKNDEETEKKAMEKGERDVVLILPDTFLTDPKAIAPTKIEIWTNEGKPQQTGAAMSILGEMFSELEHQVNQTSKLFILESKNVDSRNLRYIDFLVPGIIAFSVMQMAIFGIVFAVVEYKEKGVMKRLFATPIKPIDFTLAEVLTRLVVSLMQVAVLIIVAVMIFHIKIVGSYFILSVLIGLGSILFLALGFAIAGVAKTQDAAAPIANVVSFPQMFLANVFFPPESMPVWLQNVAKYLPLNYLADGVRRVATEAASWGDLKTDFIGLAVWIVISLFLAFKLFRWQKAAES